MSWTKLLFDAKEYRAAIARVFSIGGRHYPGSMQACYVINAPYTASVLWKLLAPLMHEDVRRRVTISSGVPRELVDALGGEAAVTRLSECSPHVL